MADLVAQVQTNLHPAIKELQEKISLEMAGNLNDCQEHYVAGLSDALGIIMNHIKDELEVGKTYYVVMPEDEIIRLSKCDCIKSRKSTNYIIVLPPILD